MFHQIFDTLFGTSWIRERARRTPIRKRSALLEIMRLEDRRVLSDLLGTAANFAVLGGSAVTNTGPSVITGNLGVSPNNANNAITGFPPGIVTPPGTIHAADAVALQAQSDTTTAYNGLAGLAPTSNLTGQNLGGLTLTPGVYFFSTSAQLTGALTLNFLGNPDAQFVFQIGSTLTTASNSSVVMTNGGGEPMHGCEVYWQIGSSATLGTRTAFVGNIVALTSITLNTNASIVSGRALAQNGAVTLDSNVITIAGCGTGSISGLKFNDVNGNGVRDAREPGLQGLTVFIDGNSNGALDPGETRVVTAFNGNYTFAGLAPGTYRIREAPTRGLVQTTRNPADVVLGSGEDITGVNFGDFRLISIGGAKFLDANGNGVRDSGEAGLRGWTIFLDANNNGVLNTGEARTTTDARGNYSFTNRGPGRYRVREVQQLGFAQSTANPAVIVARSGTNARGVVFGNFQVISISGTKFADTNGNGARDNGEAGMQGWTIFLDANNNGFLDTGEARTATDANGNYTFTNRGPGTYRVREVGQLGWVQMTNNPPDIVARSGTNATSAVFGNIPVTSLITPSKLSLIGRNRSDLQDGTFAQQADFVAGLYRTQLGRAPDLAGLRRYLHLLQAGFSQQEVTNFFRADFGL